MTGSLQFGKQEAIKAREGEHPVSTGISDIGSHPKDVYAAIVILGERAIWAL